MFTLGSPYLARSRWLKCRSSPTKGAPRKLNPALSGRLAVEQQDELDDEDKEDCRLQDECSGLVKFVHHEFIKLAGGAELLVHQHSVIGNAHLRSRQAVEASKIHITQKLDAVIHPLRQLDDIQADRVQSLRFSRQPPAREETLFRSSAA